MSRKLKEIMAGETGTPRQTEKVLWVILFCLMGTVACCCREPSTEQAGVSTTDPSQWPSQFGFGRLASQHAIDSLNTDVRPDGAGLPPGSGIAATGRLIFSEKCARCHGHNGVGGPYGSLVTLPETDTATTDKRPEKTIGNYWPYATTVFDYVKRAMPFDKPGSLTDEEVYHLTAYLLSANALIDSTVVIDAHSLPLVHMPAQPLFIEDDRKGGLEIR